MTVKLLTEQHLEFLSLKKEAAQASLSLHLSKYLIVGNHPAAQKFKKIMIKFMRFWSNKS